MILTNFLANFTCWQARMVYAFVALINHTSKVVMAGLTTGLD